MIPLIVIGSILLLIALILSLSVSVVADYEKDLSLKARILCFTVYRLPSNPKKKKKAEKKAVEAVTGDAEVAKETVAKDTGDTVTKTSKQGEQSEKASDKPQQSTEKTESKKQSLDFDSIMLMINSASPPVRYLLRRIRVYDFYLDFVIGGEDAAKTAINYGKHCALVYSAVEWLKTTIHIDVKEINIEADFDKTDNDYFLHLKAKMRLAVALLCLLRFLGRTIKNNLSQRSTKPA